MTIRTPERPMDPDTLDHEVDVFSKFSNSFDAAVKNMHKTAADQTQKCQKYYKMEFQTIGKAFQQLGNALQQDGNYLNPNLTNAITCTGEAYEDIGKMYEDQPRNDWEPLGDVMHDYRGLLMGWPGILQIHAGAISKKKEFEKMSSEGKVQPGESTEISNRTNTLSFALMAEINTFHHQRVKDMKTAHQHFLQEQIAFYHKVIEKLQDSLRMFDNC
jgi:sorting nexin-9/18/33